MSLYSKKPNDNAANKITQDLPIMEKKRKRPTKKEIVQEPEPEQVVEQEIASETNDEESAPEPSDPEPVPDNDVGDQEQKSEPVPETVASEEQEPDPEPVENEKPVKKPRVSKRAPPKPEPVVEGDDVDSDAPPRWFMKYVESVRKLENETATKKKPQKVVRTEAQEFAQKQWQNPEVRQSANTQVDSHFQKMYKQIFGR